MNINEVFAPVVDRMHETARVKTIFGDPVNVGKKTIIPVARIGYGFGGGERPEGQQPENERGNDKSGFLPTGGALGGVSASPIGVLEVTEEDTRFIPVPERSPVKPVLAFAAGMALGLALIALQRRRDG